MQVEDFKLVGIGMAITCGFIAAVIGVLLLLQRIAEKRAKTKRPAPEIP